MASSVRERLKTVQSTSVKAPCKAIATGNLTLSGEQTVDSRALVTGDRVLCSAQTDASENGPWVVDTSSWTRPLDFNNEEEILSGVLVVVDNPSGSSGTYFIKFTGTLVLGTTDFTITASNLTVLDEDLFTSNSADTAPSQQSTKVYVDTEVADLLIDEDTMVSNLDTKAPTQQSTKKYVDDNVYTLPPFTGKSKRVFAVNTGETAAEWIRLSDGLVAFCQLYVTADESIAAADEAKLSNIDDLHDAAGIWDGTSKLITVPFSGLCFFTANYYQDTGGAALAPHPVVYNNLTAVKDLTGHAQGTGPPESTITPASFIFPVAGDDELELYAYNMDTDTAVSVLGNASGNYSNASFLFIRGFF